MVRGLLKSKGWPAKPFESMFGTEPPRPAGTGIVPTETYLPISRTLVKSAALRPESVKNPLAKLGVETAILKYGEDKVKAAKLGVRPYFAALVLISYVRRCEDRLVIGLLEAKGQIWLESIEALYPYCFSRRERLTKADKKNIRQGFEELKQDQILVYKDPAGNLNVRLSPWITVLPKTTITKEIHAALADQYKLYRADEKKIRSGMIIIPDAILDDYLISGLIKTHPDFLDRLADAREKTGHDLTPERMTLALKICDLITQAAEGKRNNVIREDDVFIEFWLTVDNFFHEVLNLGPTRRARQRARERQRIIDALEFVRVGGFIEKYEQFKPRKGKGTGYILYIRKGADPLFRELEAFEKAKLKEKKSY